MEWAVTMVVMEVLGKVLMSISANPRLGNHPVCLGYLILSFAHGRQTEFRTIPLGDINLIKKIQEIRMRFDVVGRQTPRASVRRVYTAKLEGRQSGHMTVAMYEGDGAEEVGTTLPKVFFFNNHYRHGARISQNMRQFGGWQQLSSVLLVFL